MREGCVEGQNCFLVLGTINKFSKPFIFYVPFHSDFDFDPILGSFLAFRGQNEIFLGLGVRLEK